MAKAFMVVHPSAFRTLCMGLGVASLSLTSGVRGQSAEFLAVERKARQAVAVFGCNSEAGHAANAGRFGPVDPKTDLITCLSTPDASLGVAFELGPPGSRVRRARVLDVRSGQRVMTPVDTARFAQEIIAMIGASRQPAANDPSGRRSIPLLLRTAGDTIEVWYVPTTQVSEGRSWMPRSIGGERAVVVAPDGGSLIRVLNEQSAWRAFTPDTSGLVLIRSEAEEVPSLSEMMACLQVVMEGRGAAIETRRWTYVRFGTGWVVSPR
jgi:hypothetical protein